MTDLPWPWHWDDRPQGRRFGRFGPSPEAQAKEVARIRTAFTRGLENYARVAEAARAALPDAPPEPQPTPPAPEQRAASALLTEAQLAEARRHLIDPWRERRQ